MNIKTLKNLDNSLGYRINQKFFLHYESFVFQDELVKEPYIDYRLIKHLHELSKIYRFSLVKVTRKKGVLEKFMGTQEKLYDRLGEVITVAESDIQPLLERHNAPIFYVGKIPDILSRNVESRWRFPYPMRKDGVIKILDSFIEDDAPIEKSASDSRLIGQPIRRDNPFDRKHNYRNNLNRAVNEYRQIAHNRDIKK